MVTPAQHERIVDAWSTHWIKYVVPVVMYLLLGGVSIVLYYFAGLSAHHSVWTSHATLILASLLLLLTHHWFFHRILSEGMMDAILTNKRLIFLEDNIWFSDDMHEVKLENIRAVEAHKRGVIQNLFRYGSLWFDTGGSAIESGRIIPLVPHPHDKVKKIMHMLKMK